MQANLITDFYSVDEFIRFTGFYHHSSGVFAKNITVRTPNNCITVDVTQVERNDYDKKFGVEVRKSWYVFDLPKEFLKGIGEIDAVDADIIDSEDTLYKLPLQDILNKKEIERRLNILISTSNKYAIQGNELGRATALWLILKKDIKELTRESGGIIHLYSLIALSLNEQGEPLAEIGSWEGLCKRSKEVYSNSKIRYYFVLARIAFAHGYENQLTDLIEASDELNEIGNPEAKLLYSIINLKQIIHRGGSGVGNDTMLHALTLGKLLKKCSLTMQSNDHISAEVIEKLCVICSVYHRVYWIKSGNESLKYTNTEKNSLGKRLYIATFGLLEERDLYMYVA